MISGKAIAVRELCKDYRIAVDEPRATTTPEALFHGLRRLGRPPAHRTFRALDRVSLDIRAGETVGVIGPNGAGKSTLLKILSRITEPTAGEVDLYGRIGCLLEVGAGFHPELTGRENVYLNGAILGMRRAEIARRFDEIVQFAGVEEFLDTPCKRYSTGMYVRLAFAVAAHLEAEILVLDEALAVGDAEFQRRCTGKIRDVAGEGRTVLFVSHNMALIQSLCDRAVLLRDGAVRCVGPTRDAVTEHLRVMEQGSETFLGDRQNRRGNGAVRLLSLRVLGPAGVLACGRPARFLFQCDRILAGTACAFTIFDQHGVPLVHFDTNLSSDADDPGVTRNAAFACEIDELPLLPGRYRIDARLVSGRQLQDQVDGAAFFDVREGDFQGRPALDRRSGARFVIPHRWRACSTEPAAEVTRCSAPAADLSLPWTSVPSVAETR